MRRIGEQLHLSATDLAGHLACRHMTALDRFAVAGKLRAPVWRDPMLDVLQARGLEHETAYLRHLQEVAGVQDIVTIGDEGGSAAAFERTRRAMETGVGAIVQAVLVDGRWNGRADVLLRSDSSSSLGGWSYEVVDTKLASETRAGTMLQLCLYTDVVRTVQGVEPASMMVVTPEALDRPQRYRTSEYMAYYRLVRRRMEAAVAVPLPEEHAHLPSYPDPVSQCDICRWWKECDGRRRRDDHLSLVAGVSRLQRRELDGCDIGTVTKLARTAMPLVPKPTRGAPESYERAAHQARLQVEARGLDVPPYDLLPVEIGMGLARLPEPSPGDVFLDLEGDPFVDGGGREYLFGWVVLDGDGCPEYRREWALTAADERRVFEHVVDEVVRRWDEHPNMHVYHFAPYEPAAFKRLMGRHATREDEIDRLLRGERFVDLYGVVRQGMRVGVERYSLKNLEPLHGVRRGLELPEASRQLRVVERALELGEPDAISGTTREAVEQYNRDDCVSTWSLRNWLEQVRAAHIDAGALVPRPEPKDDAPSEEMTERQLRLRALFERLTEGVAAERTERSDADQARWLLAHLLEFHRREDKATWWEFFRLRALPEVELAEEKCAIGGLELVGRVGGKRAPVQRYHFPSQDYDVRRGQDLYAAGGGKLGAVEGIDAAACTVDVKKRMDTADVHPQVVYSHEHINASPLPEAIERLAAWTAQWGIDTPGPARAARDLLLRRPPRLRASGCAPLQRDGEELLAAARRLVLALDEGVLPVQGPPGSGKTYMGARMICALVRAGKRVGVTAVSHKVIRNLLAAVLEAAREEKLDVRCIQKVRDRDDDVPVGLTETTDNGELLDALAAGEANVGAGTAWAWAREDFADAIDVLVIDEAGQMSLANAIAAAGAAKSLVLLGDPQQLEQPLQGSHPEGVEASVLQHVLGQQETIPSDRGLFLAETWRLHPAVCAFTSEQFYEGRLRSRAGEGLEHQRLEGDTPFIGAGLWLVPVEHDANQSASAEEVERVAELVDGFVSGRVYWVDRKERRRLLELTDVLIVAPYNAQVAALSTRLPGARVGTVDRFQGQEAPVVIYSLTTSSPEDAPRGMEFLYSLHRLNVATSRAQAVCLVVGSSRLLEPECRTPRQIRLANALCRFRELARESWSTPTIRLTET